MTRILEMIVEPNKLYVNGSFKLKVKVQDDYKIKQMIISENSETLISESNEELRTEWGE